MVQEKYEASQAQMERDSMVLIEGKWIVQNLQCLRRQIQVPIMAVVKNNGYGLGLEEYALYLQALGIRHFGVKDAEEALRLRRAGITEEGIFVGTRLQYSPAFEIDSGESYFMYR